MAANVSDLLGLRMDELMRVTIERGASDLHMSVGLPPQVSFMSCGHADTTT